MWLCCKHKAGLHPKYADELQVSSSAKGQDVEAGPLPYFTAVKVIINPTHTGHNPDDDCAVNMATLDGRVKEFICEKARQIMLPISCIAFEIADLN